MMYSHGVMMNIAGRGVLLTGQSGVGKSEAALALIDRKHYFIADDVVLLRRSHHNDTVVGESPDKLKNALEVRGLGILNVAKLFGDAVLKPNSVLDLIVKLEKKTTSESCVTPCITYQDILTIKIPEMTLPVFASGSHNLALRIETAVNYYFNHSGHHHG